MRRSVQFLTGPESQAVVRLSQDGFPLSSGPLSSGNPWIPLAALKHGVGLAWGH